MRVDPKAHLCASCAVPETGGECPVCGTFWYRRADGKVFAVMSPGVPTCRVDFAGRTVPIHGQPANVVGPLRTMPGDEGTKEGA